MRSGWYVLNYHDVSWEESPYVRGIGNSCPPDVFRDNAEELAREGRLVSPEEGFRAWMAGELKEPMFTFWFDDGLAGVRRYALPVLKELGVVAAMSVNSRFALRREFFWRFKLALISHLDGLRHLRTRLRRLGYPSGMPIRHFVLDRFSPAIVEAIDEVYHIFTRDKDREDAFRCFDDVDGLSLLKAEGWTLANHTASHRPVGEDTQIDRFWDEFGECEEMMQASLGGPSRFWVVPFDRSSRRSPRLSEVFHRETHDRHLVLVGNRVNREPGSPRMPIHRISMPTVSGKDLVRHLKSLA